MSKNIKLGTIARVDHKGGTISDGSIIKCIQVCSDNSHGWKVLDGHTNYCIDVKEGPSAHMNEGFVKVLYTPEPEHKPGPRHFNSRTGMEYVVYMTEGRAIEERDRMIEKRGGEWVHFPVGKAWQVCDERRYKRIMKDGITIEEN